MILRRITQHVRDQNWTAIGIDFFIVVLGVFLGIQIGNWNEERSNKSSLVQSLTRLGGEVDQNIAITDEILDRIETGREDRDVTREAISHCVKSTEAIRAIESTLINLTDDFQPNFVSFALEHLSGSDRYLDLASGSFNVALGIYSHKLDEEQEQLGSHYDNMWSHHVIKHEAVGGNLSGPFDAWSAPLAKPFEDVCTDPTFRNRLLNTVGYLNGIERRLRLVRSDMVDFQIALQAELEAQQ